MDIARPSVRRPSVRSSVHFIHTSERKTKKGRKYLCEMYTAVFLYFQIRFLSKVLCYRMFKSTQPFAPRGWKMSNSSQATE